MLQRKIGIYLGLTLLSLNSISPARVHAQADQTPRNITFTGRVISGKGQRVPNCEITFTAPALDKWTRFALAEILQRDETPILKTTTNADGSFQIEISVADNRWRGAGRGWIIARSQQGVSVSSYALSRGLVDLPLELYLPKKSGLTLKLVDDRGQPVAAATVAPARLGETMLPLDIAHAFHSKTDSQGLVTLPASLLGLNAVYVMGESVGNQFLVVQESQDLDGTVTVRSTVDRELQLRWLETNETQPIPTINWLVATFNNSNQAMEFSWQQVQSQGEKASTVLKLANGETYLRSDAWAGHGVFATYENQRLGSNKHRIEAKLERGQHVVGSVVSRKDGKPLSGIVMQGGGWLKSVSDDKGNYEIWLPRISDGTYPIDGLGEYTFSQVFYSRPQASSIPGESTISPFELDPVPQVTGRVLDSKGLPVAGTTVFCSSKQERFSMTNEFLTDRNGVFRFSDVAPGTPVQLTVFDKRGVTDEPVGAKLNEGESPLIRLVDSTAKVFVGNIVDSEGSPISGAVLAIQRARIAIPGGYNPSEYLFEDPFKRRQTSDSSSTASKIITDVSGSFRTSECVDWRGMFGLKISHPDFQPRITWLRDLSNLPKEQAQFDFGKVVLDRVPTDAVVRIRVTDHVGQPIPNARVLLTQGRMFAGQANTSDDGLATFQAKKTPGIIAVSHQLLTGFQVYSPGQQVNEVKLSEAECNVDWTFESLTAAQRQAFASKQLEKFAMAQTLDFNGASECTARNILTAKMFADPASIERILTTVLSKRLSLLQSVGFGAIARDLELADKYSAMIPTEYRSSFLLDRVGKLPGTSSDRKRLLSEAIQEIRRTNGDESLTSMGIAVGLLLESGDTDLAVELISESYESHLDDFADGKQQRSKRGVARFYYPQLAMVDFERAITLIQKHAYPNEIDALQAQALAYAVMVGKADWASGLKRLGKSSLIENEAYLVAQPYVKTPMANHEFATSLATQISDVRLRGILEILAAARIPNLTHEQRRQWFVRGLLSLKANQKSASTMEFELLAYHFRAHLQTLARIDPALSRCLLFESMRELAELRDGEYFYLAQRHSRVASMFVSADPQVARGMLQPFLDDLSWHYRIGANHSIMPLTIAAKLDPDWAISIANRLIETDYRDDTERQTMLLADVVDGLAGVQQ